MSKSKDSESNYYTLKIKGRLDSNWTDWLDGMTITYEDGVTTIYGPIIDQSALHGLLNRIRDIGLQLISVNPLKNKT